LLRKAAAGFEEYVAKITETRELRNRGDRKRAEVVLREEAQPIVDRVVDNLDGLVQITADSLDQTQSRGEGGPGPGAYGNRGIAQPHLEGRDYRDAAGVLAALVGTALIAFRMTRALDRLFEATKALAEGTFREPLRVDSKDEIGALARSFNSMAARLRETDEMKEKFYATVSHELRSPLNAMSEAARLIEARSAGPLTDKQKRLLAIVQKGSSAC
jgi:signal transduction histidine kinase